VTTSSYITVSRNLDPAALPEFYFVETVNNKGQVIDLRFMRTGEILREQLCYLSSWTKFEYPNDNTIITYDLGSDGSKFISIECEMWYKTTYTLSDDQTEILYAEIDYSIDTASYIDYGWPKDKLIKVLQSVKRDKVYPTTINGFIKSTARWNGIFPKGAGFKLNNYRFSGLEFEELKELMDSKNR
jgi:hypothetical protein